MLASPSRLQRHVSVLGTLLATTLSLVIHSIGHGDVIDFDTTLGSDYTAIETRIIDGAGGPTEVVLDGGNAGDVFVNGSSRFQVESGMYTDLRVFDDAESIIRGGATYGDIVTTSGRSNLQIFDGYFDNNVIAQDDSSIDVFGGEFAQAFGATDNSVVTFFGTQLQAIVESEDPSIPSVSFRVTGVFLDRTAFSTGVFVTPDASLILKAVPEPASLDLVPGIAIAFILCTRRSERKCHVFSKEMPV